MRSYATNSIGTSYGSEIIFNTPAPFQVGQFAYGGYVFFVDGTGQHGLVCAPSDVVIFDWGCIGTFISGTSTEVGTGAANTVRIVSNCPSQSSAAKYCDQLVLNGYNDWFLPSIGELQLIFWNLFVFSNVNLGFANPGDYLSSSEFNANQAYIQEFYYYYLPGFGFPMTGSMYQEIKDKGGM